MEKNPTLRIGIVLCLALKDEIMMGKLRQNFCCMKKGAQGGGKQYVFVTQTASDTELLPQTGRFVVEETRTPPPTPSINFSDLGNADKIIFIGDES